MRFGAEPKLQSIGSDIAGVMRGEPLVVFEGVDFSHPNGVPALKGVNLQISQGELVAILGTNGAGKSTLVRHMNALLKPTHGIVRVFGTDTRKTTSATLSKRVGIVFQNANNQLFASTVRAEIEFGLRNFGLGADTIKQRADWALKTFGLERYENTPPMELSGGEKKRLCNALVLAWDPDILILDEPTVGQDSQQKEKLVQTIRMLLTQSKTVVLVSHDIEFIWPMQPRTILMHEGSIVVDGNAQDVFRSGSFLKRADILQPQLVELFKIVSPDSPFPKDEYEARDRLLSLVDTT
jgi:energy-coupling factor transporter ATP-binding protein EcfA2